MNKWNSTETLKKIELENRHRCLFIEFAYKRGIAKTHRNFIEMLDYIDENYTPNDQIKQAEVDAYNRGFLAGVEDADAEGMYLAGKVDGVREFVEYCKSKELRPGRTASMRSIFDFEMLYLKKFIKTLEEDE